MKSPKLGIGKSFQWNGHSGSLVTIGQRKSKGQTTLCINKNFPL